MAGTMTLGEARLRITEVLQKRGRTFVYAPRNDSDRERGVGCFYRPVRDGDDGFKVLRPGHPKLLTGCLVGEALTLHGEVRHLEARMIVFRETAPIGLHRNFEGMLTDAAARYLQVIQDAQDFGKSWGEAYDRAEQMVIEGFIKEYVNVEDNAG